MFPLPDGRVLLRWMFWCLGLILLLGHEFVVHSVLHADRWAAFLFPHNFAYYAFFMAAAYFYLIPTPLLCLATASGLKRNKSWARWTGATASSLLLLGFPLLTVAGAVGLYALFAKPRRPDSQSPPAARPPVKATTDLWISKRDSKAQPIIAGITMIFGFQGLALLTLYAQRAGMPAWNPGYAWWVYFFLFLLLQTTLHELGHAAMAWTVYFRVRVIAIGPFTFWNDGYGYQVRFEWKRLLDSNGYMGAVPVSEDNLLFKQIATVAGGPLVSLVAGWLLLLLFLCLPGTGWQGLWWMVAFNAVLGLCYAVMSLLPFGYSDGAMLYHLIRDTPAGRQLLNRLKVTLVHEQADAAHSRADFEKEVEFRQAALRLAQEGGERNVMTVALSHQALGHAKLAFEDWAGAQTEFQKCLEFEAECDLNPALKANSWSGLQKACVERHWVFEAGRAGAAAVKVLEARKQNRNRTGLAVTRTMLAQVQLRAGAYAAALAEAGAALAILPRHRDRRMLHAMLHSARAMAHLGLGAVDDGLSAARDAAAILGSPEIPEPQRNLASDELGELGEGLWKAGQSDVAIDLIRQAVDRLESAGATVTAAQYRIKLSSALRALGRDAEALYTLPGEETVPPSPRRFLLAERAELHLASARYGEAVADGRALLALWQSEPDPPAPEMAVAEGLLARACLEAGDPAEAEALARRAAEVLTPWGHPDAASCRITLALASRERSRAVFDDALRSLESDPLLSPAEKTRRLEAERARIGRSGPIEGTATLELAAVPCGAA
jgi:tetratricopeptide (TPR) repeat protein